MAGGNTAQLKRSLTRENYQATETKTAKFESQNEGNTEVLNEDSDSTESLLEDENLQLREELKAMQEKIKELEENETVERYDTKQNC